MQTAVAYSVLDFAKAFGIGRTKLYEEINAGRLKARKAGRRTLILKADGDEWMKNLPELNAANSS